MKKIFILIPFFVFILISIKPCFPHLRGSEAGAVQDLGIEIGFDTSHITYTEPGVMKEKGYMYGIDLAFTYRGWIPLTSIDVNKYMLRIDARGSMGQVDYTSNSSGTMNNIDDYMLEFRGLAGYDFLISDNSIITPYIGYGIRYLNDDMSHRVTTTGAYGYEREITYFYSPIGIETHTAMENGWSISLKMEYDYFLEGNAKSHLGSVPGYYDIKNNQKGGYGLRSSLRLRKKGVKADFAIEPFIRYWNIRDSKTTTDPIGRVWQEPKNTSKELGVIFIAEY